ncbi:TonB-dependent receptor [Sunxiuqinia sp. A32]|uniref:TonB-dependent receptor n=1 Tax=Sunxiuqinia sp. A32 TaxID=3461496 RepID=UPI004046614D
MKKIECTFPEKRRGKQNLLLKMKLTLLILLVCIMQVSASVYSQTTKLTFDFEGKKVSEVLIEIEEATDFRFFYQREQVNVDRVVDFKANNKSVDEILSLLFDNQDVKYRIMDGNLILLTSGDAEAQQGQTVRGKVTNNQGSPIPGATVAIKGTTKGNITDVDGEYVISDIPDGAVLIVSFVGMLTQEIPINGQAVIDVILEESVIGLEEVVAVGYGTMKKKDLTGAVSSVDEERLLDRPAFNVAQALSGKVAGVKIIERSGAPGSEPMIRIRGTNSINAATNEPLFVVDGVVGVKNALRILNPNEIESMDVLKDASATAIYGARGSNGVIIITTKKGLQGDTQVEYNGYVTRNTMDRYFYVLDAEQMMYVVTQAWMNVKKYATSPNWPAQFDYSIDASAAGHSYAQMPHLFEKGSYSVPLIGDDGQTYRPRFDTNWEREIFKPSTSTSHQLNVRGGTKDSQFGVFLNYGDENGLLKDSKIGRYSGRITTDLKVNDWLKVSANLGVNKNKEFYNDVSYFSGGIARAAVEAYSILPIQYPDDASIYGNYAGQWSSNADFPAGETPHNPVHITEETERYRDRTQVTGDVTFNFQITDDLTFRSNFAVDLNGEKYNEYTGRKINNRGSAYIRNDNWVYWQNENYFNYNKVFGDHSVTGMLGFSWSEEKYERSNMSNSYYFDDFYGWHNIGLGTATRPGVHSEDARSALNSYFARATYGFKNKYLFTVTGRVDGSSKFGANTKYGFFPSGSFAWRISEEDFAKSIPNLSNLKLRLSVGQTGNQEIGSYVTQTFIGSTNVSLGDAVYPGLFPNSVGNPDLKWETTTQYNGGLDIGLFNSRINASFEYYYKLTTDMLLDVPLPLSTTTGQVKKNYGEIENTGFEFTLGTHNIKSRDLNWFTDVTFATNKNKIKQLGPTGADILRNYWVGGANTILREGESVASFFGLHRLGTYSTEEASLAARYGFVPGDVKYEDVNGDGVISFVADGDVLGSAFPIFDMDINNSVTYKNFDFSIDIRISYGAKKENRTNHSSEDRQAMANGKNSILDAWRPDHQDTYIGQVRPGNGGAYYQTYPDTHWIEDASFVRGDGATLGYSFNNSFLDKVGLDKLRVYASARNFFVITKYSGYDPEGSDSDNMDGITPGMDFFMYPRPTSYTFGVNLIF